MKSAYLFNSKEFKRRTTKVEIEKLVEANKEYQKKSRPPKPLYPARKTQKKLIYNCYATILWVLRLLCNYPLRNMMY